MAAGHPPLVLTLSSHPRAALASLTAPHLLATSFHQSRHTRQVASCPTTGPSYDFKLPRRYWRHFQIRCLRYRIIQNSLGWAASGHQYVFYTKKDIYKNSGKLEKLKSTRISWGFHDLHASGWYFFWFNVWNNSDTLTVRLNPLSTRHNSGRSTHSITVEIVYLLQIADRI
jgi:hypothetical protein